MAIKVYARQDGGRTSASADPQSALVDGSAVWIDLFTPTAAEDALVEAVLGINIPTLQDRAALEDSARFYEENGALYLTAFLFGRSDDNMPVRDAVTFILDRGRLVTVRTHRIGAFEPATDRATMRIESVATGQAALMALLEALVERTADAIQSIEGETDSISDRIFGRNASERRRRAALRALGGAQLRVAYARSALASLKRLLAYCGSVCERHGLKAAALSELNTDVSELERLADSLQTNLSFLLDSALGLVSADQNATLKTLSLVTIAFAPPMLIASFYGMNFTTMPGLANPDGWWLTLCGMMVSAGLFIALGRWRGWF
jgi:magnesium transporter